ncbi:hypothetical protein [Streptomyces sp. NPDC006784]|uniref:hypothetical protein n=1 Tax=Streptomyces sp. NPDC006784 TaxID=3364764 RepID=UPI0036A46085
MTRPHGYARYKLDGCRCYTCGFAAAQYRDARDHAIRRGTWQPYVDAEPARAHVRELLACGLGTRTIAALAHLDRKQVYVLLHGRSDRGTPPPAQIRPATAAAILSVEPTWENLPGTTTVAAVGTVRRLQALTARGWPQSRLAARLDMTPNNFGALLAREHVTVATARRVRSLYDELWRTDPRDHRVDNQAYSRALNQAKAKLWAPVGAWDDDTIDDPQAYPDWTGHCGTSSGYNAHFQNRVLPACQPCLDARSAHRAAVKAVAA